MACSQTIQNLIFKKFVFCMLPVFKWSVFVFPLFNKNVTVDICISTVKQKCNIFIELHIATKYVLCCVFRPAVFQPFFNLFCSFQSIFSDFTAEITKKRLKLNKKKRGFVLILGCQLKSFFVNEMEWQSNPNSQNF